MSFSSLMQPQRAEAAKTMAKKTGVTVKETFYTLGAFEFKEHVVTFGLALLPAYWYFWRKSEGEDHASTRRWLTVFLAFAVWYAFLSGHVANDFRGVGS